jgi:hypothetical protein
VLWTALTEVLLCRSLPMRRMKQPATTTCRKSLPRCQPASRTLCNAQRALCTCLIRSEHQLPCPPQPQPRDTKLMRCSTTSIPECPSRGASNLPFYSHRHYFSSTPSLVITLMKIKAQRCGPVLYRASFCCMILDNNRCSCWHQYR